MRVSLKYVMSTFFHMSLHLLLFFCFGLISELLGYESVGMEIPDRPELMRMALMRIYDLRAEVAKLEGVDTSFIRKPCQPSMSSMPSTPPSLSFPSADAILR